MNASNHRRTGYRLPRRLTGFSLIEVMIVVAIVAILAAIAIPSYTNYVVRGNMAEGMTLLTNTAQALERCYSRFSAYNHQDCGVTFPRLSENGWYQVTAPVLEAAVFTLHATPQGNQATRGRGKDCGVFTLNQRGQRGLSASGSGNGNGNGVPPPEPSASLVQECWRGR